MLLDGVHSGDCKAKFGCQLDESCMVVCGRVRCGKARSMFKRGGLRDGVLLLLDARKAVQGFMK